MRVYEKPALTLLTVSANDALCANCSVIMDENLFQISFGHLFKPFSESETQCETTVDFEGKCKFTGANQIFTS